MSRRLPWLLGLAAVLVHVPFCMEWGFHRDELYFLACARNLSAGYVDHPPLVPWLTARSVDWSGQTLWAVRSLTLCAVGLAVFTTATLTRQLGGGRGAMGLASLAVLIAPVFLRTGHILGTPSFEPAIWTGCLSILVAILQGGRRRSWWWIPFGLLAGVGLLNKHTMLVFGAAVTLSLLVTDARRSLRGPWPWVGLASALALFGPNLAWQAQNGWPTWNFARALGEGRSFAPLAFMFEQVLFLHPCNLLLAVPGLIFLLRVRDTRYLGWTFVVVVVVMALSRSKGYYSAPIYPLVFAAGAVCLTKNLRAAALVGVAVLQLAGGTVMAPVAVPVLSVPTTVRYTRWLLGPIGIPAEYILADQRDMLGWRDQAEGLLDLCPDEVWSTHQGRQGSHRFLNAPVLVRSYGQAGAIEHFVGRRAPEVLSPHMTYWFWGRVRSTAPQRVVAFGIAETRLKKLFAVVRRLGLVPGHPEARLFEQQQPVFLCSGPRSPWSELWPAQPDY